jgi:GNAT superfamily N-acetyltransferase
VIRQTVLEDLEIRALGEADVEAAAALALSRGWAYDLGRWRFVLEVGRGWGAFAPDGALVGTVQSTSCTAEVVAIGSMVVAAPLERRGIGRALLERVVDEATDQVVTLAATRSGRPLYERLGFEAIGELVMYPGQGTKRSSGVVPAAGHPAGRPAGRPAGPDDLPAIVALDRVAHGGDRSRLLAALLRFATAARVLPEATAGGVRAFAAAWPSQGLHVVGPVVAADDDAAVVVVEALLSELSGPVRIDVHSGRSALRTWLEGRGFTPGGRTTVMVRRPHRGLPGRAGFVYAPIMQPLT